MCIFARQNFCPYPIHPHFSVAVKFYPCFILHGPYTISLPIFFIVNLFYSWTCIEYLSLNIKQTTINQSQQCFRGSVRHKVVCRCQGAIKKTYEDVDLMLWSDEKIAKPNFSTLSEWHESIIHVRRQRFNYVFFLRNTKLYNII